MRTAWLLALFLLASCASISGTTPSTRQFELPIARVKPAFISAIVGMGMTVSALEVRSGHDVIKARKQGSEVEIDLEPVTRASTRARVAARSSGLLYDDEMATRIIRQAERTLGGT